MTSTVCVPVPAAKRALYLTTLALPMAGWAVHAVTLHRKLSTARLDPLTGLHTRDGYTTRSRSLTTRHPSEALVVLVDVDHFKQINDTYGHATGDLVLSETANRLRVWAAGNRGIAGRLGGDEFALTVRISPSQRRARLRELTAALAQPVAIGGQSVDVAVSVGAAPADTLGTTDLSQLQRAADAAMYAGKHTGIAIIADPSHTHVPSIHGRRAGRSGAGILRTAA
ncbi:GGDEF domain-containing protein [Streptomyces sp. NPDC050264]|uniref:GGDEF domain-containing protein n=1 Tax=Streptomyces sp. NPDC050264 TaxID=3155038 RepID=UPI003414DB70